MTNIFFIHGAYGDGTENWFPWLKKELEKLNFKVIVPKFPTPENQTLESWMNIFENYKQGLNENSILIGHSLGCPFILNLLEKINYSIKSSFLIAGWTGLLNSEIDKINKTFIDKKFNWKKIRNNCRGFMFLTQIMTFIFHYN